MKKFNNLYLNILLNPEQEFKNVNDSHILDQSINQSQNDSFNISLHEKSIVYIFINLEFRFIEEYFDR